MEKKGWAQPFCAENTFKLYFDTVAKNRRISVKAATFLKTILSAP